jgi:hypothetical protein
MLVWRRVDERSCCPVVMLVVLKFTTPLLFTGSLNLTRLSVLRPKPRVRLVGWRKIARVCTYYHMAYKVGDLLCCVNSVADIDELQFWRLYPEVEDEVPLTALTTVLIQRNCEANSITGFRLFLLCAFSPTETPNVKQNAKIYAFLCRLLSIYFFKNISWSNVFK